MGNELEINNSPLARESCSKRRKDLVLRFADPSIPPEVQDEQWTKLIADVFKQRAKVSATLARGPIGGGQWLDFNVPDKVRLAGHLDSELTLLNQLLAQIGDDRRATRKRHPMPAASCGKVSQPRPAPQPHRLVFSAIDKHRQFLRFIAPRPKFKTSDMGDVERM